ncbi:hypothetical protein [Photobacterium sanguinicancri]|uniref:hypothetical protein n=1 Tax=Photobacterium sanguinicancri TaxID=875932 RepID=UPI0026E33ABB|nr:hypothetical protein [Photobacterium sanguinicancri]MDO6497322.1 hypothetical protein [Photobacterium sanguinicancri]
MAFEVGTANNHSDLLEKLKVFATKHGWSAVRHIKHDTGETELWLHGKGESGVEKIYLGFKTESSYEDDRFNLALKCSPLFSNGAKFNEMPNSTKEKYFYLWQHAIPYFFVLNKDFILIISQISTKSHLVYLGKLRQYCSLGHWPRQMGVFGESDKPTGRWSDEGDDFSTLQFINPRANEVLWIDNTGISATRNYPRQGGFKVLDGKPIDDTNDRWLIQMFCIHDKYGALGEFQRCFYISGRNVATGQRFKSPDGNREFVVVQNIHRAGFKDYMAVELA